MNGSGSVTYQCEWCMKFFLGSPSRSKAKHICCSKQCMSNLTKRIAQENRKPNTRCPVCNKNFWCKPSHLERFKQVSCSKECGQVLKKKRMMGQNNHQFNLKGKDNPSWKSDTKISTYGYRLVRVLDHPFKNSSGFVFEHRLVAEKYLLKENNSVEVNGKLYLKPELEVHHIDENKLNNHSSNLLILTKAEHRKLHNNKNPNNRDKNTGKYTKKEETQCLT